MGFCIPDGVPAIVPVVAILRDQFIALYASYGNIKRERRALVMVAVDIELDPISIKTITARHSFNYVLRFSIVTPHPYVQKPVVVDDLELGLIAGWGIFVWAVFYKIACPIHDFPSRVVELTVDYWRFLAIYFFCCVNFFGNKIRRRFWLFRLLGRKVQNCKHKDKRKAGGSSHVNQLFD